MMYLKMNCVIFSLSIFLLGYYISMIENRYNKDMTRLIEKINVLIEKNKFVEIKPIILII